MVRDEAARPVRAVAEVALRRRAQSVRGQGDLGSPELHVVAPARLGVEGVGEGGHQRVRRVLRRRAGVEEPCLSQLTRRPRRVRAGVLLGGEGEGRRHPADEVGTDPVTRGSGAEHRTVRDEPVGVARVGVVRLGQPPEVVVAAERAGPVARADPDLDQQRAVLRAPHLHQPRQTVPCLGEELGRRAVAEQSSTGEQQHVVVRRGVGELQVVAGVEPAARDVDRTSGAVEVAVEDQVGAVLHPGPPVDPRVRVVQVGGLSVERSGDDVRTVALVAVEGHTGAQQRPEDVARSAHGEPRRACGRAAHHLDPVPPGDVHPGEVEPVDGRVAPAPGAGRVAGHLAGQDDRVGVVDDPERGAVHGRPRHQPRLLRLAGEIALLVDPDHAVDRGPRCGGSGGAGGARGTPPATPVTRAAVSTAPRGTSAGRLMSPQ